MYCIINEYPLFVLANIPKSRLSWNGGCAKSPGIPQGMPWGLSQG